MEEERSQASPTTKQWDNESNLSQAQRLKQQGNAQFVKKQYKGALRKYHQAILHLAGIIQKDSSVAMYTKTAPKQITQPANALKFGIWLNMSQIYIYQEKYEKGLQILKKAQDLAQKKLAEQARLKLLPKLYYRKGVCFMKQNYFDEARKQFRQLVQIDSSFEKQIEGFQKQIKERQKQANQKSKKLYQGFFK